MVVSSALLRRHVINGVDLSGTGHYFIGTHASAKLRESLARRFALDQIAEECTFNTRNRQEDTWQKKLNSDRKASTL